MPASRFRTTACASAALLLLASTAQATTLWVNCSSKAGLTSINAALKVLQGSESRGAATINVSGACHENVQIRDTDRLTINGGNASVSDTTNGVIETIGIYRSTGITISGLTILGGSDGISVGTAMANLVGITARGAVYNGVGVYPGGNVVVNGAMLEDNGNAGLGVFGGDVNAIGVTSQGNWDGFVVDRGRGQFRASDPAYDGGSASVPAIISGNNDVGVVALHNGEVTCSSCQVTGNHAGGISLDLGSSATFRRVWLTAGGAAAPFTITDNGGPGVAIGDLSSADFPFDSNTTIRRNAGPSQIMCNAATSVTRRARGFDPGTNCGN
jgi:hypothetical protein